MSVALSVLTTCCMLIAPDVLWTSNPVMPSQSVVSVYAKQQLPHALNIFVNLCAGANFSEGHCVGMGLNPKLLGADDLSAVFMLPARLDLAVFWYQLCRGALECSQWHSVNNADPIWAQGNLGQVATSGPSGWLRVFGRALGFGMSAEQGCLHAGAPGKSLSRIRLVPQLSDCEDRACASIVLDEPTSTCFDLTAVIPCTASDGAYSVEVTSGLPGSTWVPVQDSRPIIVHGPQPMPTAPFRVTGRTGAAVSAALLAAGAAGGGQVLLEPGIVYDMLETDTLYIPHLVTLTTDQDSSSGHALGSPLRAVLQWTAAAPRLPGVTQPIPCLGPGQERDGIFHHNRTARFASCPPLLWGNGTFAIVHIHARAPALSALVEVVEPSVGASVRDCVLEVLAEAKGSAPAAGSDRAHAHTRAGYYYANVSNALHIGNCTGFEVRNNTLLHVADGAVAAGDQYGGLDTPAPCGQHSPDNYAFFFDQGASDGIVYGNTIVMGCNGWGTQSHQSIIIESNNFTSVGIMGVEGSGFSSASTVPRANQAAVLRNVIRGTNAATGPHTTPWTKGGWANRTAWGPKEHPGNPLETITSDGSYGGYFGNATAGAAASDEVRLRGHVSRNEEAGGPPQPAGGNMSAIDSWREAALVVIAGTGLGQVRRVLGSSRDGAVRIDRPLTTPVDNSSVVTITPYVGRWLVAGNLFSNGTSVQTYGVTLQAVFADNVLENMTKSAQVDPAGICLTSGGYGSGVMPNVFIEVTGNRETFSEGIHLRCGTVNGTSLTYGIVVRNNTLMAPPPDAYMGNAAYPDSGLGPESGGHITTSHECAAGVIEGNVVEVRTRQQKNLSIINHAHTLIELGNSVLVANPPIHQAHGPASVVILKP